jgi:hypothetical protein
LRGKAECNQRNDLFCRLPKIVAEEIDSKNSFSNPLEELDFFQFKRAGDYYLWLLIYMEKQTILDLQGFWG